MGSRCGQHGGGGGWEGARGDGDRSRRNTPVGVGLVAAHFGEGALTDVVGIRNALLVGAACLILVLVLLRGPLSR